MTITDAAHLIFVDVTFGHTRRDRGKEQWSIKSFQ